MIRSAGRRAAFVAALVGLLAALTSGALPGAPLGAEALAGAASRVLVQTDGPAASAPSAGLVSDGLRAAHPVAAARATTTERSTGTHSGGWAVAALLLLLAACALAVGVRRATSLAPATVWRAAGAPRAPPAPASC